jgi:hypothetical protein
MSTQRPLGRTRLRIPYPRRLVTRTRRQSAARRGAELRCEDGLAVTRNAVGHARHAAYLEHGLRLGAEGDGRLEGVLDAMVAEELEEVGWVLVDNDLGIGDVYTEAVGQEIFLILDIIEPIQLAKALQIAEYTPQSRLTLAINVFSSRERFFSDASARGTSMTSAICFPSPSRNRALNEPAGPCAAIVTSCWTLVLSRSCRFCRFEGGGTMVAIAVVQRRTAGWSCLEVVKEL